MAVQTLALTGELTISHAAALQTQLLESLAQRCHHLDLAGVTECDSAGVQLLLALRRSVDAGGGQLVIEAASETVRECLRRYGLDSLLLQPH